MPRAETHLRACALTEACLFELETRLFKRCALKRKNHEKERQRGVISRGVILHNSAAVRDDLFGGIPADAVLAGLAVLAAGSSIGLVGIHAFAADDVATIAAQHLAFIGWRTINRAFAHA